MGNVKISQTPNDSSPASADYLLGDKASGGPTTQNFKLSDLATYFWTLANVPAGGTSPITRDNESQFAFVASGLVWSGDSYGSTRNASMTAGVCYINGRRISIAAVTARTFTASKDTYIDVLDNGDGTGTLVYTEVTNNAASPALAANSIRIGIIITGASNIANSGSVNQGQETMVLPIASSIAYSVTDSIGNLICPRDPSHKLLSMRQIIVGFSTSSGTPTQITGLSCPVIVPTGRKIKATLEGYAINNTVNASAMFMTCWEGVVNSGAQKQQSIAGPTSTSNYDEPHWEALYTPSSSSITINAGLHTASGTASIQAGSQTPLILMVELE